MGCVFFEMLTGRTPFHSHNMESCRRQHMEETPPLPSEFRAELANWTGLDGLVMRLLAKNRDDRPQDAEVLSQLDSMQIATGQEWQKTVAVEAWQRPQTISEKSQGWQPVVPVPTAQPVMQPVSQPVFQPVSQPVIQAQKPASQKVSGLVWGALAVVVVMAVAAGFAAVHYFAPKSHSEQTQAQATQPVVIPPRQAGSYTYTDPNPATAQQKPSPGSLASGANIKPTVLQTPVVLPPAAKPPAQQPSVAEIEQQAVSLFNQKRFSEANPLLDKACTGGSGEACKDLGNMYHDGSGVGKDGLRAASFYSKSCSTSPPKGCTNLGVMYHKGDGVAQNDVRAGDLYSRACDAGDGIGCANLGNSYWNGSGVAHDDTRAAALYSRACDIGNAAGCSSLGLCYGTGRGVGKDLADAKKYFTKGCGLGNTWGCDRLKEMK
jgi:TPR repeat protein